MGRDLACGMLASAFLLAVTLFLPGCAPKPKEATGALRVPPRPADLWTLEEVRDSVLSMVQGAAAPGDTAVHVRVEPAMFRYWYVPDSASGYAVHAFVNRDSSSCLLGEMERALTHRGWAMHHGYAADGPDGSVM